MPKRIQRKRTKGWRMPEGAVYVGRPTMFGNPVAVDERCTAKQAVQAYRFFLRASQAKLLRSTVYEDRTPAPMAGLGMILWREKVKRALPDLRGKDLVCWCPLDKPCHADVLLQLANAAPAEGE